MPDHLILGFPIRPMPLDGLPGAEIAAPFREELNGEYGAVWKLKCPVCGKWGDIDEDQLHGRVSVDHTDEGCTFHETHDFYTMLFGSPGA